MFYRKICTKHLMYSKYVVSYEKGGIAIFVGKFFVSCLNLGFETLGTLKLFMSFRWESLTFVKSSRKGDSKGSTKI